MTIIELDADRCEQVSARVGRVIQGDGTDRDLLEKAGVERANVVAALTDDTDVNLAVCEAVHGVDADIRTILRIAHDRERDYGHRHFVDDIVYPAAAGAKVAVERITRV